MGLPAGLHRKGGEGEEAGFCSACDGLGDQPYEQRRSQIGKFILAREVNFIRLQRKRKKRCLPAIEEGEGSLF
jgi:hypothetical protein